MQILIQYTQLLQEFKIKEDEITLILSHKESKLYQLYHGIITESFKDDEGAAKALYNQSITYPPFKALKTELKKRLINAILVLDFKSPSLTDVQQAYYQCQKNWAAINILMGRFKADAAIDLAQTTLELAKKYEITETIANTSRVLVMYYHLYRPLSKLVENYEKIYNDSNELLQAEYLADRLYDSISKHYIKTKGTQRHLQLQAQEFLEQLKPYSAKYNTFRLQMYTRMIELTGYMSVFDYKSALRVADEAISFFDSKPFELKSQYVMFLHQKTICCIQLQLFEEGKASAERSRSLVIEGTYNWFKDGITYIRFCFYSEDFDIAWRSYIELIYHPAFYAQNNVTKEELRIYDVYFQFLITRQQIIIKRSEQKIVNSFKLKRFLNDVPIFQKDKRGLNIAVLVAQIIWLIYEKKYNDVFHRIESLSKYRTRYISKNQEGYRTAMFIGLLYELEKCGYNKKRVNNAKARRLFENLKSANMVTENQAYASEVFAYELSWRIILELLP